MGKEEKTITISKEEFFKKSMDTILKDDAFGKNGMGGIVGMALIITLTKALFPDEEGGRA